MERKPLLRDGIENQDIFRTLCFHFKSDNYVPIEYAADFVISLLKRPIRTNYDKEAEERFKKALILQMVTYAENKKTLTEKEFCVMMDDFSENGPNEYTDEQQYDLFLDRIFLRIRDQTTDTTTVTAYRKVLEKAGFKINPEEFLNATKPYFRNKDRITKEEFKMFAAGKCERIMPEMVQAKAQSGENNDNNNGNQQK